MTSTLKRGTDEYRTLLAHKLLTPLATISANLSLLRRPDLIRTPEDREEAILDAEKAVQKLRRAIECMLAMQGISPGDAPQTPGPRAVAIIEMKAAAVPLRYPDREARIETDLDIGSAALPLAPEELEMVMEHLLDNALLFCDKPQACVRLHASSSGPSILLTVEDNGRGVDPEDRERVFEAFVQCGDRVSGCRGVGLGLSLVKRIVLARNGTISLESAPGAGTTVRISLPVG